MSETWLMNETIGGIRANFVMKPFPPDSNNYVESDYTNETFFLYAASGVTQNPRAIYQYQNYDGDRVDRWFDESYRTWEFLEPPTGELLTWLQENGVKQSAGGIGLKNLSSYNQDLSVPRKKDLDALETKIDGKQPKITVNGIVQGDGAGNLSAAEVVEADVITLNPAAVGLGNVDNVKQYSASNPPPYPVISVNGQTGAVSLTASDVGALPLTGGKMSIQCVVNMNEGFIYGATSISAQMINIISMDDSNTFARFYMSDDQSGWKVILTMGDNDVDFVRLQVGAPEEDDDAATKAYVDGKALPTVTSTDDGKFLRVVSGAWAAASVPDANGGAF